LLAVNDLIRKRAEDQQQCRDDEHHRDERAFIGGQPEPSHTGAI